MCVFTPHCVPHTNCHDRTQYTTQLLTTSILAYSKKRSYEDYTAHRTTDIWESREELISYENALRLEAEIDDLAADGRGKDASVEPGAVKSKSPLFLSPKHVLNFDG